MLVAAASVLSGNPDEGPLSVTLPVAAASALALAFRRRVPIAAVLLLLVPGLTQTVLAQTPGSLWSLLAHAIVMYSLASRHTEGPAAALGLLLLGGLLLEEHLANGVDYLFVVLLFGGLWLLGRASRIWRNRVTRAEQHQRDAAALAVAEERVRIARELHDILAQSLGVIAIQADAALAALAVRPELAVEPVTVIRTGARESLGEIRRLLGALRVDAETAEPAPGIGSIPGLITTARSGGIDLDYRYSAGALPAVVEAAAYRIVRESITNLLKHAPGSHATLFIAREAAELVLRIGNDSSRDPAASLSGIGLGLIGIRERVTALGGTLTAGPTPAGGFLLEARLPLDPGMP